MNKGVWSYGLLSHTDDYGLNYILGIAKDIKGLTKPLKKLLTRYYRLKPHARLHYSEKCVVLFRVKDVNPDLITWDMLNRMSQVDWITIIHNFKIHIPNINNINYTMRRELIKYNIYYENVMLEEIKYKH